MKYIYSILLFLLLSTLSFTCKQNCSKCDSTTQICYECSEEKMNLLMNGECTFVKQQIPNCLIYSKQLQCSLCESNYRIKNKLCIKKIPNCIDYDQNNKCSTCLQGLILQNNQCLGVENCQVYANFNQCIKCIDNMILLNNKCRKQKNLMKQNRLLRQIDSKCAQFVKNVCVQCSKGYKKNQNNQCVDKIKDPNCLNSDPNGKCLKCPDNFWIKDGICSQINIACKTANQLTGACITCFTGFRLAFGNCVTLVQDPHCSNINPITGVCQKCSVGYFKVNGLCKQNSLQCIKTDPNGNCINCYKGYSLNSGRCIQLVGADKNCEKYIQNICVSCKQRYFIINKINCAPVSPSCLTYNPINGYCLTCSSDKKLINNYCQVLNCKISILGVCQQCMSKFYFTGGKCIAIPIKNCDLFQNNQCAKCSSGYFWQNSTCVIANPICKNLDSISGRCIQCIPNYVLSPQFFCLDVNCQSSVSGNCIACNLKFYLQNNTCKRIPIINCDKYDTKKKVCQKCSNRFYITNETCSQVNQICNEYNQSTGYCINCFPGFILDQNYCKQENCSKSQKGKCLVCKEKFYLEKQKCIAIPIQNCDVYNQKICLKCSDRYFWNEKICESVNPTCKTYNNNGKCLSCVQKYKIQKDSYCVDQNCDTSQLGLCKICKPTFFLSATKCINIPISNCEKYENGVCTECSSRFYLTSNNFCNPVNPSCNTYKSDGKCITCSIKNQIIASDGYCMDPKCKVSYIALCRQCIQQYYVTQNNTCCQIPILNCISYQNKSCSLCKNGFSLIQGICKKQANVNCLNFNKDICTKCKVGFILTKGDCVKLAQNCIKFSPSGQCLNCAPRFIIKNKLCVQEGSAPIKKSDNCDIMKNNICIQCSLNYWKSGQYCVLAGKNCLQFDNRNGACKKCPQGFRLQGINCITVLTTSCKIFDKDKKCMQCIDTFVLTPQKICKPIKPLCATFNKSTGDCLTCYQGYKISDGNCLSVVSDPNCKTKAPNGVCQTCSNGFFFKNGRCTQISPLCASGDPMTGDCLSCYSGFALNNGACIKSSDQNCKIISQGLCTVCQKGYVVKKGLCTKISQLCLTFNQNNGNCLTCFNGYTLRNGTCLISILDPNCKRYEGTNCKLCSQGFILKNNQCIQVSPLCNTYNSINGLCTSCFSGFKLNQNGTCQIVKIDPNCKLTKDGICVQCSNGYRFLKGICTLEDLLCKTIDQKSHLCSSCYQGYSLKNGKCEISANNDPNCQQRKGQFCLICNDRYWLSNNICLQVSIQCQTYNPSNGYCTSCFPDYIMQFGNCVPVPKNTDPYCSKVDLHGNCTACYNGYYISQQGACKLVSALCKSFDFKQRKCLLCEKGYFLQQTQCIYPALGLDPQCIWYDNGYCSKCNPKYYVSNFQCTTVDQYCLQFNYELLICDNCAPGKSPLGPSCL